MPATLAQDSSIQPTATWADLSPALSTMRALLQHAPVVAARPQRSPAISDSPPAPELPAQAAAPAEVVEQEMSSLDGSDSSNTALTGARVLSAAFALLIATLCLWQLIKWRKECRQRQQASGGEISTATATSALLLPMPALGTLRKCYPAYLGQYPGSSPAVDRDQEPSCKCCSCFLQAPAQSRSLGSSSQQDQGRNRALARPALWRGLRRSFPQRTW